jgi:hypothetical protein
MFQKIYIIYGHNLILAKYIILLSMISKIQNSFRYILFYKHVFKLVMYYNYSQIQCLSNYQQIS